MTKKVRGITVIDNKTYLYDPPDDIPNIVWKNRITLGDTLVIMFNALILTAIILK